MNENVLRIYIILYRFLFEEGLCHISVYSFHQWVKDIARKYRFWFDLNTFKIIFVKHLTSKYLIKLSLKNSKFYFPEWSIFTWSCLVKKYVYWKKPRDIRWKFFLILIKIQNGTSVSRGVALMTHPVQHHLELNCHYQPLKELRHRL